MDERTEPKREEHRDELLRLVKGSPQPEVSTQGLAERMGVPLQDAWAMIDELIGEGRLRRDGDRLIVVERAGSAADAEHPVE